MKIYKGKLENGSETRLLQDSGLRSIIDKLVNYPFKLFITVGVASQLLFIKKHQKECKKTSHELGRDI